MPFTPFQHINAIGVELEGGWRDYPCECHEVKGDGSVSVSGANARVRGEIPIGPLYSWSDAESAIRQHYPNVTNRTCGLHVHLSFPTPGHYSALMSPRFEPYLVKRLAAYGRKKNFTQAGQFFARLRGENTYCSLRYSEKRAMSQATATYKGGDRYALLNYCHGLHGTIECRVLPAFMRPSAAVNAIRFLCDSFNRYLSLPGALVPDTVAASALVPVGDTTDTLAEIVTADTIADFECEIGA